MTKDKETGQEVTRKKIEDELWSGQSAICTCGHHYEHHYTDGEKTGCRLCKECNEFITNAFYANSIPADEILDGI